MIPASGTPRAAHRASDAAAFRLRSGPTDWRELYRRRKEPDFWAGWGLSGVLHVAMLLALAAALLPLDLGDSATLLVELSLEPEETPLETFVMLPEDPALEADATGGVPDVALDALAQEIAADMDSARGGSARLRDKGETEASPGKRGSTGGAPGPKAEYFGTVAYGDRFVYILDKSGSMNELSGKNSTRYDRAAAELVRSVEQLREDQWFYVIVFSDETRRMLDDRSPLPQMVQATAENKRKLRNWLYRIHPDGDTDPRDAVYLALLLKPSAVFLLSDGEFNGHKHKHKSSMLRGNPKVEEVVAENNQGKLPIHTIAYEDMKSRETMHSLARQTGGVYRFIAAPGEPESADGAGRPAGSRSGPVSAERRAAQLLRLARSMESADRPAKALKRYEEIAQLYPQTPAGQEAATEAQRIGRMVQ